MENTKKNKKILHKLWMAALARRRRWGGACVGLVGQVGHVRRLGRRAEGLCW